jgi:hypothetical protein
VAARVASRLLWAAINLWRMPLTEARTGLWFNGHCQCPQTTKLDISSRVSAKIIVVCHENARPVFFFPRIFDKLCGKHCIQQRLIFVSTDCVRLSSAIPLILIFVTPDSVIAI